MKKTILLLLIPLLFGCFNDNPNNTENTISTVINDTTTYDFSGIYHFGESEMESDLILVKANEKYYAQIKSGEFNDNATDWIWSYRNLYHVKVDGNLFFSEETNGEFITEQNKIIGLKAYTSWSALTADDGSEIGEFSQPISNYYSGDFTEASTKKITKNDLKDMSKSDLAIMRNEIFARYGYLFKEGSEMSAYFNSQKWYKGQHKHVDQFLSDLEKENCAIIKTMENNAVDDSKEFPIEDFPKKWFLLDQESKDSEKYVINAWCEAEPQQINIEKKEAGNWVIYVMYGQDSDKFKVINFEATTKEMGMYHIVSGNFIIEKPSYDGGGTVKYNFVWNKDLMFAYFDGIYRNKVMMVSEQNRDNYKTVVENCDYLEELNE